MTQRRLDGPTDGAPPAEEASPTEGDTLPVPDPGSTAPVPAPIPSVPEPPRGPSDLLLRERQREWRVERARFEASKTRRPAPAEDPP